MMIVLYLICGLFVFWYAWWGERVYLEDALNYYAASLGFGGSNMYYPSIVALVVSIYAFYGYLTFR